MREDDARAFHLVRAVELSDDQAQLLTEEDRRQATAHALAHSAGEGKAANAGFLAARSRFAADRLATRHPAFGKALGLSRWPRWITLALPLLAFMIGIASNELDGGRRLELLGVPLLGVIAWNLAIYVWIAIAALRPRTDGSYAQRIAKSLLGRLAARAPGVTGQAISRFSTDWSAASARLNARRASSTLHLSAALFALGLCAGIFLRALTVEYRAGWESTFLSPEDVQAVLALILGPASALTGIDIPDPAGIEALRWTGNGTGIAGGGANAGPWIVLWTATLVGAVAIPRLVLAGWDAFRARWRARRLTVPGREDFYVRRLLRASGGGGGTIRITPYAYTPDTAALDNLRRLMRDALGDAVRIEIDPPVLYGDEEEWVAKAAHLDDLDLHIPLFSLTATPEDENHGEFVDRLIARQTERGEGGRVATIIDEGPFRRHFAGQRNLEHRIGERSAAWNDMLRDRATTRLRMDLGRAEGPTGAEQLESALLGGSLEFRG